MNDAAVDYDAIDFFRGNEIVADPYPYFDWLRTQCPVHREPQHGVYMVTGYDEACAVYADTDTFSSCNSVTGPFPGFPVPLEGRDDVSELIEQHRDELPFSDQITDHGPAEAPRPPAPGHAPAHAEAAEGERGVHVAARRPPDRRVHRTAASASSSATTPTRSRCSSSPTCSASPRRSTRSSGTPWRGRPQD